MARIDAQGVAHPTEDDPLDAGSLAHIAFCPECNRFVLPEEYRELAREAREQA